MSLGTDGRYARGLERLEQSVRRVGFEGELMTWRGTLPAGCPPHLEVPFAFKPLCITEAWERGLEQVLWVDAMGVAVQTLDPLFERIDRDGYLLFRNKLWKVGEWASDDSLALLGLSRDEAMEIPEVNAAAVGLDCRSPTAREFLRLWREAAHHGVAFRGVTAPLRTRADYRAVKWNTQQRVSADPRVQGHRHDQTVAGVLAHRLGLSLTEVGLQPYRPGRQWIRHDSIIVQERSGLLTVAELMAPSPPGLRGRLRYLLRRLKTVAPGERV